MRVIFEVINEIFIFKRVIQYFTQKTSIANYVQRFKKNAIEIIIRR